ncbi:MULTISPECIES: hypothetical protein [Microbacterium]|uniref:hypothetical protein n=1 Tax=Microbacterium TaxID=33882 RepID=UPI001D178C7E|nr:hypothetical protein [Microbacterium testaceum]MCC4248063.1 hypothetical protein [Microbacterium testaceum]
MTPALAAALARAEAADAAGRPTPGPVSKTRRIAPVVRGVSWTLDRFSGAARRTR